MLPAVRARSLRLLSAARPGSERTCRDVEALCHACSATSHEYNDRVLRAAFNLRNNPSVGEEVVHLPDDALTRDTLVGRIRDEAQARQRRFDAMLKEKYESLDDTTFQAIVRCRRCGSAEVTWQEKQVRSADEGATVFCSCATCKNRWVMRQ